MMLVMLIPASSLVVSAKSVSKTIQKWVDLIFGYKARGKEAELANNIFSERSYQESINLRDRFLESSIRTSGGI